MRLDYKGLNDMQIEFLRYYREHRNGRLAVEQAGYKGRRPAETFKRLMENDKICELVTLIDMQSEKRSIVTKDWIETKLVNIVLGADLEEEARFKDKNDVQLKALKQLTDLHGFDEPQKHLVDSKNIVINYYKPKTQPSIIEHEISSDELGQEEREDE